jgi:Icc protein
LPRHDLIQISDVHLTPNATIPPGVRPRDNLLAGLALLATSGIRPDLFVLTGDLANEGDSASYRDLAEIIGNATSTSEATVVYLPGNHDARDTFRRYLMGEEPSSEPINQVVWQGGLRVIALDSTVPGEVFGALADETLDFLRAALVSPAPDGTVLALHHPPISSPIEPMSRVRLQRPELLAEAIAGSDVRLVLCGHNHHEGFGTLGSVGVWVSPAAAYRADVTSRDTFRGISGSAFSRIDLDDEGSTASVIHIPPSATAAGSFSGPTHP